MAYGTADLLRNAAVEDVTATTNPEGGTSAKALVVVGPTGSSANQVQGTVASGATDSGNPVKVGGRYNSPTPTLTNGQRGDLQLDARGAARVTLMATDSSAPLYTDANNADAIAATGSFSRLGVLAFGYRWNGSTWDRAKKPNAAGRIPSSANSTNATVVKASAGDVFNVVAYNGNAAARYLKIYNKATAPTVGTDTPVLTIPLPPTSFVSIPLRQYFSAGISIALTTGAADSDTGAVGAGDVLGVNVAYQ